MNPCKLNEAIKPACNGIIAAWSVGDQTCRAILDPGRGPAPVSTALIAQGIQRAVAKQAIKSALVADGVARKVFTAFVLKKTIIILHDMLRL